MRKLVTILLSLVVAFVAEARSFDSERLSSCEVKSRYEEQLECCHHHNIDAERTSTLVVPSRTTTTNLTRQGQQRTSSLAVAERYAALTNYPTIALSHRLRSHLRSVVSHIYLFCQLRL